MTEQYKMFSDKEAKGLGKKFIVYVCASLIKALYFVYKQFRMNLNLYTS